MTEKIQALLGHHPWADKIQYFDTIDSTNLRAKDLAAQGAPGGTVLLAGQQTLGRGRLGRSFHSPAGSGVYMSVILRPQCRAKDLMHLTCATAVAMADAVEDAAGLRPGIKWINDLVIGKRKLGGILTELSLAPGSDRVSAAIVGIGINCTQEIRDFPPELQAIATSLSTAGCPVAPEALAAAMIRALHAMSEILLSSKSEIMDRYRESCITLGQSVAVHGFDSLRHGTALAVDADGALVVHFSDGRVEAVSSGEVSVRAMYGYV